MAKKRMFSTQITESDCFLEMPPSTQNLYFHLGMNADDDGFLNNSKKIQRVIGASDKDLQTLINNHFVIKFDSGIVVIKHWLINNSIRSDRYNHTTYTDEYNLLYLKENKAYSLREKSEQNTDGIPNDNQVSTDGMRSIDKNSIDKNRDSIPPSVAEVEMYIKEKNLLYVEAESFINYYESIGWMIGKHKMKSWKSAISGWNSRNKPKDIKKELITKDKALEGNKEIKDIFDDCQENYPPELCSNNDFEYFLKAIASDSLEESIGKAIKIKLKIRGLKEFNKPFQEVLIC